MMGRRRKRGKVIEPTSLPTRNDCLCKMRTMLIDNDGKERKRGEGNRANKLANKK